jgi:glutathione S-transferase
VAEHAENPNVEMVKRFLRAQNLEQVARVDEAVELYEGMLAGGFDSVGPYDRLIEIYSGRALHGEVVRVADVALVNVHTYPEKKDWYRQMREAAAAAATSVPKAVPKPGPGATPA